MTMKSRLGQLESSLTPRQAVLNHIGRLQRFESVERYCGFLARRSANGVWVSEIYETIRQAAENARKRGSDAAQVRMSVRHGVFLYFLHQNLIMLVANEERPLALLGLLVEEKLGRMIASLASRSKWRAYDEEIMQNRSRDLVDTLTAFAIESHAVSAAIKSIEDKYFQGMSILFRSSKSLMNELAGQLEHLLSLYHVAVLQRCLALRPIKSDGVQDASLCRAEEMCQHLVMVSKTEALAYMGSEHTV